MCLGAAGLWCSSDFARTFAKDSAWGSCRMLDWGAGRDGSGSTMYVFGQLVTSGDVNDRMYVQVNQTANEGGWERANPPSFALGEAVHGPMVASKRRWGEVFVAADGQGVYHGRLRALSNYLA